MESHAASWDRIIAHADMDAFYAQVEQLDNPDLRGRPLIVGHPGRRGVVTTASYEARPFGVGSAMSMIEARRRCPHAVVVSPRFERYAEVSRQIMDVFATFSPLVEALSLDEAFIDLTGAQRLWGSAREVAAAIKREVSEATGGLTVSVGVSNTKYVAKVASDYDKPDGLVVVVPEDVLAFLQPLPLRRLWGVGPKTEPRIAALGLNTIGEVANADPRWLEQRLGRLGRHIHSLANGRDARRVVKRDGARVSVGSERTLSEDIVGREAVIPWLRRAADDVARRLRKKERRAGGIRVKLKTHDFQLHTRQRALAQPTDSAEAMLEVAEALLDAFDLTVRMRLVGIAAYDIIEPGTPVQGALFDQKVQVKRAQLDSTLDSVHARYGARALRRGSEIGRSNAARSGQELQEDLAETLGASPPSQPLAFDSD